MTVLISDAVVARDPGIADMAQVFRMQPIACLRHEVWPQLWPLVAVAVRNGLPIIWQIVLMVEFLGCSNGVGFQIYLYFQLLEIVPLELRGMVWWVSAT